MLKQGPFNCVIALSMALLIMPALTVNAQPVPVGVDMGVGYCLLHRINYTGSCPRCRSTKALPTQSATTNSNTNIPELSAAERIKEDARLLNSAGKNSFENEDWVNAIAYFQEAVNKDPADKDYQDNLANAKAKLSYQQFRQREVQQAIDRNKTVVTNMQQSVQNFTQALNAAPPINGSAVDEKNSNTNAAKTPTTTSLQFGDPNVVNAQNVPSGLSKGLNEAIAAAYGGAPAGVSNKVSRGFEAVQLKDWKLAKAWFGDALRLDPGNEGLKKFIELCDYSPQDKPATSNVPYRVLVPDPNAPSQAELNNFFKEFNIGVFSNTPAKVLQYVRSMSTDEFRKYLDANLSNKQLNDIMFDNLIKLIGQQSQ